MQHIIRSAMKVIMVAVALLPAIVHTQSHFSGPRNMGPTLNGADIDASASISPDGLSLYFQSVRTGGLGATDVYVSRRRYLGSAWGPAENLGSTVNSSANDNIGSLSLDGRTMFLQSNRSDSLGAQDIYISTRLDPKDDFGWTTPVNLGAVINSKFAELNATYFEDPVTGEGSLIFSSDRVAMNGLNHHFYQSMRNADGTFNPPTLITELNSEGSEFGVAIRRDGLEIYFASSRPGGLNIPAFDIWTSTRPSRLAAWDPPVLAPGINGVWNERLPKLSPDGSVLYVTSDRPGGFGGLDLYSFTRCSLYSDSPCGVNRTAGDFNADGVTDISVFRPSEGNWWVMESGTNEVSVRQFGASGDTIVPGDYDGDGRIDLAVFRPSDSSWWILRSSDTSYSVTQIGSSSDKPVPGDYDGDGRTDIAVYGAGTWSILPSSGNGQVETHRFGLATDIPVLGSH